MYDFILIGGGIVGLATAFRILETKPKGKLLLLEKEGGLGRHQTGHNSGVLHAGLYYKPGSLKAKLAVEGLGGRFLLCGGSGHPARGQRAKPSRHGLTGHWARNHTQAGASVGIAMQIAATFTNPPAQADSHPTAERESMMGEGRS